jgi:cytidylate kinase
LKERPDVLHVRVIAPPSLRAERIARAHGIPLAAAREQVEASDRARREYVRYYHADWDDPELYDLVINTGRLTPGRAAALVCLAVQHR